MTPDERAQIRAEAIRECIDALPGAMTANGGIYRDRAIRTITALLPKPDPAKQLVDEWLASIGGVQLEEAGAHTFAQWIIETGRLKV